ncbi:MAG: hypothetical protein ACREJC_08810, partial [Tepidisphaeraceae bacterium]
LRDGFARAGKKLDMGKCCIRFRKIDDIALDAIGDAIRCVPASKYIALYQSAIGEEGAKGARKPKASGSRSPKAPARSGTASRAARR